MTGSRPLVVCVTGPTATGKTESAVAVCEAICGEVISMDSMQIYSELAIGTAKPTPEETRGIPHHLIGHVPPSAAYAVAEYQRDALRVLDGVLARGKLPVFCGGTGLYLHAVSHPLRFGEAAGESAVRERLTREIEAPDGPGKLHARLAAVDPESAARLHINNTRRIVRALEIYELTGKPMSERDNEWEAEPAQDWLIFALTWPRETLIRRIDARVDRMIARGLVDEVRGLLASGIPTGAQAIQAIGYKEIVAMLGGACGLPEAVQAIKTHTRQYAKRQMTWLRRDLRVRWVDLSAYDGQDAVHRALIAQIVQHQEERHAEQ